MKMRPVSAITTRRAAQLGQLHHADVVFLARRGLILAMPDDNGQLWVSPSVVPRLKALARKHIRHRVRVIGNYLQTTATCRKGD